MHHLFNVLVLLYKVVDIEYFMDKMCQWEISNILDNLEYAYREEWERTRWLMYITAQVNSSKRIKVTDIFHFPWDDKKVKTKSLSDEDIARLKKKAQMISNKIINN